MRLTDFLNRLQSIKKAGREYTAHCPAHDDKKHHLYVKQVEDRILVTCQHGCSTESVVAALNLTMADLFVDALTAMPKTTVKTYGEIVATYDYTDESGKFLFQTVRYEPKDFSQRHRNGNGEWVNNLQGVRRVIYRLPEVLKSETVFVVEGEKDADNLWKAGLPATTSPMGAGKWKPEYASYFAGKDVIVIPDKDEKGMSHARDILNSGYGIFRSERVILLPGESVKDISDWLEQGGDAKALLSLAQEPDILFASDQVQYRKVDDSIIWNKTITSKETDESIHLTFKGDQVTNERTGVHAIITISSGRAPLAWTLFNIYRSEDRVRLANTAAKALKSDLYSDTDMRRDLDAFCLGLWPYSVGTFTPELMEGDESETPPDFLLKAYILQDGGTVLYAPPGRGKSYTGMLWAVCLDAGIFRFWKVKQSAVLFINLERSKSTTSKRLARVNKALGLPGTRPLHIINARGKNLTDILGTCKRYIKDHAIKVIILDSISRAGYGDLNENQPVNKIIDTLNSLCPTWVALAHTSRANEDHAYGSIMLDAGADICVQLSTQVTEGNLNLGLGFQITKNNDVGAQQQEILAMEFNEFGLTVIRRAKDNEFPEIEGKVKRSSTSMIMDYVMSTDSGDATATEIAKELGMGRPEVSRMLNNSKEFMQTRRNGHSVYYGPNR